MRVMCLSKEWSRVFPGVPTSVRAARSWLAARLPLAGVTGDTVETAILVLSELASNAVRHTASGQPGGSYLVTARVEETLLRVQVSDQGSHHSPHLVNADPWAETGRGLALLASLTCGWGSTSDTAGRTVFAELPLTPASRAGAPGER